MKCSYCDSTDGASNNAHWSQCKEAPDFVKYQALAELRFASGGTLAPTDRGWGEKCIHNHIDRNEPECTRLLY